MRTNEGHGHAWIVGVGGMAVGLSLMVLFPKMHGVAGALVLVALFHLLGLGVVLGSAYALFGRRIDRARGAKRAAANGGYDFGWSWGAMWGPFVAAGAVLSVGLGLQLAHPAWWPAWFVLALFGVAFFAGGVMLRATATPDLASLPLVDWLAGDADRVLDAGCGGGRTTLAVSKVLRRGTVVAVDRFDAAYIDGGGRALFERNLAIAGLAGRVEIRPGDLAALPIGDGEMDAAVSAHAMDHLGDKKQAALGEIRRVLRPGGRFLMVVWVPGWVTFCLANMACLALTGKVEWRAMAERAGLVVRDEGTLNGMWFAVMEKAV